MALNDVEHGTQESDSKKVPSRITLVAFREVIQTGAASITLYSHSRFDDVLGRYDQLVLQAVVNNVDASAGVVTFDVQIEHSADGIHWMPKTSAAIHSALSLYGPTYPALAVDDGSSPSLALVRLAVTLSSAAGPIFATAKITVTGNNSREHEFAERVAKFQSSHDISEYYYLCYPSGHVFSIQDFTPAQQAYLFAKGYLPKWGKPTFTFPPGVTCCFRPDRAFILVKDGVVILSAEGS